MKKRNLYKIEQLKDCCIVYRIDNNYGRQGVVFKHGTRLEYFPYKIPQYIIKECLEMLNKA